MNRHSLANNEKYLRALQMRSFIEFKSRTGGLIPYLQRQALQTAGLATMPIKLEGAPKVSSKFERDFSISDYKRQEFTYEPLHTMKYLGRMDGYNFGTTIPKFDPWFRDLLREVNPSLEESLTAKFVRDPSTPERIMKHFQRYDQKWQRKPTGYHMRVAQRIVSSMFKDMNKTISPIDFNYAGWVKILRQLEFPASPGLPLRREYSTQADCLPFIYDKSKRLNHFAKFLPPHKVEAPPCMIGLRPGLTEYETLDTKVKARGVWSYPAEVKVVEMRYTIPILERLSSLFGKIPYVTGVNMNKALPMVIDDLLGKDKYGMVFDISHLDDSVGPDYIAWAFSVIENWMDFGFTKSSEKRNYNVFKFIQYYFTRTLILLPSGQLVRKAGGVPSGSGFTQLIDTLVSLLINVYALLKNGMKEEEILMYCVGDDVAISVPANYKVANHSKHLESLGFQVNRDKIMFSPKGEDLIFLGYSKYGGHVKRDLLELIKQALFPERFVGSHSRSCSRLLGQYVASGCCSAAFGGLVERAFYRRLYRPLQDEDVYEPQARWIRKVLDVDELPKFPNAFSLFYLT